MRNAFVILALAAALSACQAPIAANHYSQPLLGKWRISSINQHKALNYSTAYRELATNGELRGNNSCNEFEGSYHLSGKQLNIDANHGVMKACVDALMAQQQQLDKVLPQVQQLKLKDDKLQLLNSQQQVLVKLVRAPENNNAH